MIDDVGVTPDGRRLITASEDGTARIWDLRSGHQIATVTHRSGIVDPSLSIDPDGQRFATSGATTRVWSVADGRAIATLPGQGVASFSPDGAFLVTGSGEVWDAHRERVVAKLGPLASPPLPVRHGTAPVVFLTRSNGSGVVATLPSGRRLAQLEGRFAGGFVVAAFARDGSRLAIDDNKRTSLWDAGAGRRIATFPEPTTIVAPDAFDAHARRLLTGSQTGVRIWDVQSRRPVADLPLPKLAGSASFSPDGRLVVTASFDGFARVWEARTGRLIAKLPGRSEEVWNEGFAPRAVFARDNETVVAATGGSSVFVSDCAVCAPLHKLLRLAAAATSRTLTPDERVTYLGG